MERLEMLENETIIELANRMLAKRQETGNEVESSIYGITVSTENCQKPEDIELQLLKTRIETYERNAEEAEHNYLMAAFAEQYQKREKGPSFPILVLSPQAEEVQRKEQDKQKEASNQFYLDFQTKNDIDWNNSDEVYGWMATIIDDLNNFDARLPLNEIYSEEELSQLQQKYQIEHLSSAQVVLDELKKHGYTGEKIEIHSKDDFNRQYIANYINELEKYGMLLTEKYVDVLKDGGKEAEEEIINVVYRQAQDVLENSQDKNIDQVAFDEQKMEIAEEVSDVARRREKINFILDVAKAAPSLELIANATTAVQVSTDIKKENLETKLATIVKNSTNLLNNEQTPETPVMEDPDLTKEVQDYLSYEEDYKAKMNNIYSSITEDVEQLIEALYQKESQQAKKNTQVAASEEYNKVLQKVKTNAQKTKESLDSLPSGLMPIIDTSEILKLKPSGQINTNDETWAIQNFYKVNRGEATEADIQRTNELIEKIPDSPYYQSLKDAMEKWEPYYTEKYHPEIIAQRLDDAKKPTIDTSEILKLKPSGQINTNDETWAIQNFYKVNRGEATETDIQRTNELIEKIPDSPYYQPLKDAMEKWEPYYTEKYHPEIIAQRIDDAKKPKIDTGAIWNLTQSRNNDELWALQYFYKVNRGEATEAELKAEQERIEKIQGSPYYQPLKDAMEKWEPYYTEKYHPEIIAQRIDDAKKPKIDMNTIWYAAPSGRIKSNDETWAIQNFYKVNKGEATEAELKAEKELIEKIQGSPYYQPLKEAMEKWESYYNEKYNPRNEKNKLEQKTAIYNQILDLNKDNKLSDKEKLSNLLSDARNKNIFTTEELKDFEELLVQGSKEQAPIQLPNQADKAKEDRLQNLENKKQELNELVKGQASKEEVEAKLREIAKPILENLDRQIKNLEFNLNNIKSSDADLVNKIIAEWQRKAPNNIDKSKITAEAITQALNKQLQSKLKEKQDLEQKISDFVQLHEKIKNKDYPGLKKDEPKKDEPPKNILTLDDEEVEGLTNPSNKLRDKINRLKNKGVVKTILGWIKEHPVKAVALLATTGIIGVVAVAGIGSLMGNKVAEVEKPTKEVSQEADDGLIAQSPIADTVDEAIQQATNEAPTVDNNSIANQVLADEQARIATGSDAVYQDVHSAASEQNKQYAQSSDVQSIWQNATVEAGKMYQVEANGALTELNGVDALVQAGNEGKTIISTWQNEDGTLGRSVITPSEFGQSMENAEESAKTR